MNSKTNSTQSTVNRNSKQALAGSVKFYKQHLVVCTGGPPELWATRVEEMEGLFARLNQALKDRGLNKLIKLAACDMPSMGTEGLDIFLMPDMLVLPEITIDKVEKLANALEDQFTKGLPFDVRPMAGGDHLFVCTHANRDERCGIWGIPFYQALQEQIKEQDAIAEVYQISHVGGHKFAATCLIYPQGIWYGNLRAEDAARLVAEHLNEERLLPEYYRGRLGTTSCQQVAEAAAATILLKVYSEYESLSVNVREEDNQAHAQALAVVRDSKGYRKIKAVFTLSCENMRWTIDEEPLFKA